MPNRMPMVSASEKLCRTSPPKISMEITISCVEKWVMMVRDMVRVMALSMMSFGAALRILRKFSRIRSNTTTDSLTE